MPAVFEGILQRASGMQRPEQVYSNLREMGDANPIADRLLDHLNVAVRVAENDMHAFRRPGGCWPW